MTKINLNDKQLHNILRESIKKVAKINLNEEYVWWGDTKPLEIIRQAAEEIVSHYENDDDYDDPEERAKYDLLQWAKKVAEQADDFIRYNAHNVSINGGEDW